MKKPKLIDVVTMTLLVIMGLIIFFPILVTLLTSLKPAREIITATPGLFPEHYTLDNYRALFSMREFNNYLFNSVLVATLTTAAGTVLAAMAAYAFVWMEMPAKRLIARSVFVTYMFPGILLVIPLFLVCYELNLIDNKFALVVIYLSFSLPFSIWVFKSSFESFPSGLLEAAKMDGCNEYQCLTRIVLPLSLPVITTVATLSFVLGWNEYLVANTLITSDANRTIAIGLQTIIGYHQVNYGLITAAGIVMVVPIFILFLLVQRYLVQDFTLTQK